MPALTKDSERAPAISAVVVSWNTKALLLRCLRSLLSDVEAGRVQVWVVDNASTDGSAEAVRTEAPWANLIEAGENLGFGRAVNLGARATDSQWIAAANADVTLERGALEIMLRAASNSDTGYVAPRLILPSGASQHSVHPFPTVPFTLAFNLGLFRLTPRLADRYCLEGHWNPDVARNVPWAIGAFLLIRRSAFDAVGGFDETQWMYAEDLDLSWRLHRAGWSMSYEPSACVHHDASAATTLAWGDAKLERFMAATYGSLMRTRGPARTWAVAGLNMIGAAARFLIATAPAIVSPAWRYRRDSARRWLSVHRRGLRSRSALLGQR